LQASSVENSRFTWAKDRLGFVVSAMPILLALFGLGVK